MKFSLTQDIRTSLYWTLTNSVYSPVLLFPLLSTMCLPFPVSSETEILKSISRRQVLFRVVIASDTLGSKEMKTVVISQSLCSKVSPPPHLLFLKFFYPPSALVHIPYTKQSKHLLRVCFKGSSYSVWLPKSCSQFVQSWLVVWISPNFRNPRTTNCKLNCILIRCLAVRCVSCCEYFSSASFTWSGLVFLEHFLLGKKECRCKIEKKISPEKCTLNWMRTDLATFQKRKWHSRTPPALTLAGTSYRQKC